MGMSNCHTSLFLSLLSSLPLDVYAGAFIIMSSGDLVNCWIAGEWGELGSEGFVSGGSTSSLFSTDKVSKYNLALIVHLNVPTDPSVQKVRSTIQKMR